MVVVRCTRRLLRHLEGTNAGEVPTSTTRLGDWFANLLVIRRQHLVLAVSGVTLLPVLIAAAPYKTMLPRMADGATEMLRALGVPTPVIAAEAGAMRDSFVTNNDRRVLGSMNDFMRMLDAYLDEPSLTRVALRLAEAPCGPLRMESPRRATTALFSTPRLRLVKPA